MKVKFNETYILSRSESAKLKSQQILVVKTKKPSKIYPEGTRGPIGLESISFFQLSPWLHSGIKKSVKM